MIRPKLVITVFIVSLFLFPIYALAGTILSSYKYAWSNNAGYINFANVTVSDSTLSGYAWSANYGWINLAPAQGGVSNDVAGNLSGSAWGQQLGWIDFNNVFIDPSTGKFSGTATGELVGTITFNCSYCDVRTDWRGSAASNIVSSSGGGSSGFLSSLIIPILTGRISSRPIVPANNLKSKSYSAIAVQSITINKNSPSINLAKNFVQSNITRLQKFKNSVAIKLSKLRNQSVSKLSNLLKRLQTTFRKGLDFITARVTI